jgi:cell division protein FtsB
MNKRKIIIGLELFVGTLFVCSLLFNLTLKTKLELLRSQVKNSKTQIESLEIEKERLKTRISLYEIPIDSCFLQKVEACINCAGDKK